jgi:hypothetical protein
MSALARPGVLASILAATAVVLHPALGAARFLPARPAVLSALLLLGALALGARAARARERRTGAALTAAGATLLVGALAVDGLRGHHGTLTLAAGQSSANFEEVGPDGRSLGLRPLGFPIGAGRVLAPAGSSAPGVALALPGRTVPVDLTPERSVAFGGYRFARPAAAATGAVARLRIAASDGTATRVADVSPGAPGRLFDLTIGLEEYFPDFALDGNQRPFSRSAEPRNPAALLAVEKGTERHRVFVLQSMPGVHRVEGLGLAFSLLAVEPERTVAIAVHREPAALGALVGALLLAAGVALSLRLEPAAATGDRDTPVAVAAGVLVALLLLADRGAVLAWTFALPAAGARVLLPGVGVLLGAALVAVLGGGLLLAAGRLAGGVASVGPAARGASWLGSGLAAAGLLLAGVRVAGLPVAGAALLPLAGLAVGAACLASSLLATRPGAPSLVSRIAPLALPLAVLAALAIAIAASISGVLRDGMYTAPYAASSAAAALLGLASLEPTRAPGLRAFAFLLALLALAVH